LINEYSVTPLLLRRRRRPAAAARLISRRAAGLEAYRRPPIEPVAAGLATRTDHATECFYAFFAKNACGALTQAAGDDDGGRP
jgi:hypothetical protein